MARSFTEITDQPLKTSEDIRIACDRARLAALALSDALYFLSRHLYARLKFYEKKKAKFFMMPAAYWRCRAVAVVMKRASSWTESAAKLCDKTWRAYMKHYADEMQMMGSGTSFKA